MIENNINKLSSYNVICFGFLPWSNMWKRNQSMMAEIAKWDLINRVIFINPLISIRKLLKRNNGPTNIALNEYMKLMPVRITEKLLVYTPINVLPYKKYLSPLKKLGTHIILRIMRKLNAGKPYILFMNCPNIFSHEILDKLINDAALSIFDLSDDFLELGYNKETIDTFRHNVTKYVQAADMVITVNEHVKRKYKHLNSNIYVVSNATNYLNFNRIKFNQIELLENVKRGGRPIIGYSGTANMSRIDVALLDYLIESRPDWQFIFIGHAKTDFTERYADKRNFSHIPPVNYQALPDYMKYFDVAIVPFVINKHTKGNDLLKLHDYLAMGKPIVSTEIGGAKDLQEVVSIAHGPTDFLKVMEDSIGNESQENILMRKNVALKNSWQERIKELEKLIER